MISCWRRDGKLEWATGSAILADPSEASVRTFVTDHWPALSWSLLIAVLLLAPGDLSEPAPAWLSRFETAGGDKLVHAALFFVHAAVLARTFRRLGVGAAGPWAAAAIAAAYGLALELLQLGVDGREWDSLDVLADVTGVGLWWLARFLFRWRR